MIEADGDPPQFDDDDEFAVDPELNDDGLVNKVGMIELERINKIKSCIVPSEYVVSFSIELCFYRQISVHFKRKKVAISCFL